MASPSPFDLPVPAFSVAVVDEDPKLRTRLAMQLGEAARAAAFGALEAVDQKLPAGSPLVLVVGPSFATPAAMGEVSRVTRARPEVSAVMVVHELSTEILQAAIRAGISDVVALAAEPGQLREAVERATQHLNATAPPAPSAPPAVAEDGGSRGRIVTVFSTKGGAGKSFVATNLAVALARRSSRPVVLLDADLQFGDVAVMLGLVPTHTVIDAVNEIDRLDVSLLQSLLIEHEPSGLRVLAAPIEPAFADSISLAHVRRILDLLASFASHVVIDTPASFNDIVLGILEQTDDIVLMAGMDIPNIKNTKIGLQTLRLLHVPPTKVKLTLNRANSKVKLDIADVERTLQLKADCLIPSDIAVPQSINKGVPIVLDAPRSSVARSLERLAELFPAPAVGERAR
ncbi:MAG: P-loop NTPase [Actinobacteria bacterium]|nr:P-loop NTPase [Actinomycetota bacterium]MBW3651238.1 P-loop NTPase [Actinomycetota bacterium]